MNTNVRLQKAQTMSRVMVLIDGVPYCSPWQEHARAYFLSRRVKYLKEITPEVLISMGLEETH